MPRKAHPWYRKSDGWWYIKINGKQVKLTRGLKSAKTAEDKWHELMAERARNPAVDSDDHTVASVIDLYLSYAKRSCAPRTYSERHHYLQRFAEEHGFRLVTKCRPIYLTSWIESNAEWKSDWTRASVSTIVQRPFNWAVKQGLLASSPFRGITYRRGAPRRAMTDDEFRQLLRVTAWKRPTAWKHAKKKRPTPAARYRQVLLFLRYTGARPQEMARLTWDDVDLQHNLIVLHEHKTSRTQRTPKPRIIPLVPAVAKLLSLIKRRQPAVAKNVFLNTRGNPWNRSSLSLLMQRLRKRAGISKEVKMYGIRHQFGTQSIVNGVDIKTLAELMGHSSTRMTEHYLHLVGQRAHLAAAMQKAVSRSQDS